MYLPLMQCYGLVPSLSTNHHLSTIDHLHDLCTKELVYEQVKL